MSNKIRYFMKEEVAETSPLLHETYMRIGRFHSSLTPDYTLLSVDSLVWTTKRATKLSDKNELSQWKILFAVLIELLR